MPTPKLTEIYRFLILQAGWSERTDRFWPRAGLRMLSQQFQPGLGDFMYSGDSSSLRLNLSQASHRTNRLYLKEDDTQLWAEIQLLDTQYGRLVGDLARAKSLRIDCLSLGKVNRYNEVDPESVQYLRVVAFGEYK